VELAPRPQPVIKSYYRFDQFRFGFGIAKLASYLYQRDEMWIRESKYMPDLGDTFEDQGLVG
jgi:hypothetical protein